MSWWAGALCKLIKADFSVGFVNNNADGVGLDLQSFIPTSVSAMRTVCKGQVVAFSPVDQDIISFALSVLDHHNVPHTVMFAVGEEFPLAGQNRAEVARWWSMRILILTAHTRWTCGQNINLLTVKPASIALHTLTLLNKTSNLSYSVQAGAACMTIRMFGRPAGSSLASMVPVYSTTIA